MTNQRKHGKHSAALPETQPAGASETVAKTGAMTNRELEEKFATKEELKQSEKFLVEKTEHEKQLHSQELRSVETNLTQKIDASEANLTQKIDANEARSVERTNASEANLTQKIDASEANLTQKIDANEANLTQKIDANEARADEFRSDVNRQFEASEARSVERTKNLMSMIKQQSEKNLYKTAFIVVIVGASLIVVYQFVKPFLGG